MADVTSGIKDILIAANVGTGTIPATGGNWGIYLHKEPDAPDNVLTVYRAGAWDRASNRYLLDFPVVQVRVRTSPGNAPSGITKIQEVKDALLGITPHDRSGDRWAGILFGTDIVPLGPDQSNRFRFVINFNLIIEPASNALTNRIPLNT